MNINRRNFITGCSCMVATPLVTGSKAYGSEIDTFSNKICTFGSSLRGKVTNFSVPSPEAVKVVDWITDIVGIRQNFRIMAADIKGATTAFATIRNGRRYIVYDRSKFSWSAGKANWEDIFVMGHEVGHHIASHVYTDEYSGHEQELEADKFSGVAMSKLGAALDQATSRFWDWPESETHPGGARRKKATAAGWRHGEKIKAQEKGQCKSGWLSDEKDVDGSACRVVRSCKGNQETIRLACKDYDDRWRWIR